MRFERDIYFIELVFRALERLARSRPAEVRAAVRPLEEDLAEDLLRQVAEYASGHAEMSRAQLIAEVSSFVPEGRDIVSEILEGNSEALAEQLAAAKLLDPYTTRRRRPKTGAPRRRGERDVVDRPSNCSAMKR